MRIDPLVLEGIERWAAGELRSTNAQVEFLLREALRRVGRGSKKLHPKNENEPKVRKT
ncbi:MAG: Arc family DNA binding domain-containing protein [Deltaproteobacteria bacterium]|nr:Arc family DNA binding domain-containing protein [Deltaproteobacteria bacterium]